MHWLIYGWRASARSALQNVCCQSRWKASASSAASCSNLRRIRRAHACGTRIRRLPAGMNSQEETEEAEGGCRFCSSILHSSEPTGLAQGVGGGVAPSLRAGFHRSHRLKPMFPSARRATVGARALLRTTPAPERCEHHSPQISKRVRTQCFRIFKPPTRFAGSRTPAFAQGATAWHAMGAKHWIQVQWVSLCARFALLCGSNTPLEGRLIRLRFLGGLLFQIGADARPSSRSDSTGGNGGRGGRSPVLWCTLHSFGSEGLARCRRRRGSVAT